MTTDLDALSDEEYFALCRKGKEKAKATSGALTNEELVAGGAVDTTPADPDGGKGVTIVGLGSPKKKRSHHD